MFHRINFNRAFLTRVNHGEKMQGIVIYQHSPILLNQVHALSKVPLSILLVCLRKIVVGRVNLVSASAIISAVGQ